MRELLEPLGGEESLRLFCGVEEFKYWNNGGKVEFVVDENYVTLSTGWDKVFCKQYWSARITKNNSVKFEASHITNENLVLRIFEIYTNNVLSF